VVLCLTSLLSYCPANQTREKRTARRHRVLVLSIISLFNLSIPCSFCWSCINVFLPVRIFLFSNSWFFPHLVCLSVIWRCWFPTLCGHHASHDIECICGAMAISASTR
jgi:hypothetical protein